jgi:hypothetical protein
MLQAALDDLRRCCLVPDAVYDDVAHGLQEEEHALRQSVSHHSRLTPIALFSLMFVFVCTDLSMDVIGALPYFNLSEAQVSLLVHNLLVTLAPCFQERWIPSRCSREWYIDNCPVVRHGVEREFPEWNGGGIGFVFDEPEADYGTLEADSLLEGKHFDVTVIADGSDVDSGSSTDRIVRTMLRGIKTKTMIHRAVRYLVFVNVYGWILGYTPASTAAFREVDLLLGSKFLSDLNDAFASDGGKGSVLLRLDRGYFELDITGKRHGELTARFPHLDITVCIPHFTRKDVVDDGKGKKKKQEHPFDVQEHNDNLSRTSHRTPVEITNHDIKRHGLAGNHISTSEMPDLDLVDCIRFSMANYDKQSPHPTSRRAKKNKAS